MNCRICANHPDSGWLAVKSTWIALKLISWRHNRKRAIEVLVENKNAICMQNHPKTELHMHSDPQMRSRVQLFWSIITIHIFSTITSLRSSYAFWLTNEKPFATFLLDPNDSHFFDQIDPWEALATFFTFKCNRSKYLTFLIDLQDEERFQWRKEKKSG